MTRGLVVRLLPLLLICLGAVASPAAEERDSSAVSPVTLGDLSLIPWQPSDSYEAHEQFDSRLDATVQLWRAGMPLQELFADLAQQTGVRLDFWPPGTDDARVCVTCYLNPQHSPSLRAVMTQLSWVTGCIFAYRDGPSDRRVYYLLGTSIGQGVAEKLAAQSEAQMEQFRRDWEARREAEGKSAAGALEESRKALVLSREEAIARYRGANDALLLNLLDPSRRAALSLLVDLPEADADELVRGRFGMVWREWSAWSADQQAVLKQALGLEQKWPKEGKVYVLVGTGQGGTVSAMVQAGQMPSMLGTVTGVLSSGSVSADREMALRRYLGEAVTAPQEEAVRKQQQEAQEAQWAAWREQRVQQAEQAAREARTLSSARQSLLMALSLSPESASNALWQLQEAVAKATGLNLVSDCFWLPSGQFAGRFFRPRDLASQSTNALDALSAACAGRGGGFGPGFGGGQSEDLGLEWGDAGAFLVFRSKRADIWRAAMLPADVQTQLNAWLEPYLGSPGGSPQTGDAPLAGDIEKLSWLAGRLNDIQVWLGGTVVYENPADPTASRRQAMRRATLQQLGMALPFFRLMATFTPEQWTRVKAEGLRWGYDLTPDQQSSVGPPMFAGALPEGRLNDVVIQIGKAEAQTIDLPDGTKRTIPPAPALDFMLDGKLISQIRFSSPWW